jgi:hypothetical protein
LEHRTEKQKDDNGNRTVPQQQQHHEPPIRQSGERAPIEERRDSPGDQENREKLRKRITLSKNKFGHGKITEVG